MGILLLALGVAALLVDRAWPLPARLDATGSQVILDRDGAPLHVFLATDDRWRIPLGPEAIDPVYIRALLALEDSRFFWHPGVDPIAVARAALSNVVAGEVVSGASTLTMQVVRMAEPRPRTLRSKVVEAARALQLSAHFTKEEILALYLQLVPYGRNVEGVEAASLAYFGHRSRALAVEEIALLLAVPQDPNGRYPILPNHGRLKAGRLDVAQRLEEAGIFPAGSAAEIDRAPLPAGLGAFPRLAPHAARFIRARHPGESVVVSSLSRGAQTLAEGVLARYRARLAGQGIHNGAAVVLDHRTGEALALVGNFDFWDDDEGGQYAAFAVPRSVGSTLKPFLYAQAIDGGLALPGFLVPDVPVQYGSYSPENYDGGFAGLVTLEESLARSLNIPFVDLLHALGLDTFLGLLRDLGAKSLKDAPGYYGLSAVAGGVELPPVEVASLFMALAQGGVARPVSLVPVEEAPEGAQVLSPGATALTRRALMSRDRPDFPDRRRLSRLPSDVHWKTGTSYGHRDAWAVGSNLRYTALVWLGNLDNEPSRELVGGEAAGPLLFDLLDGMGQSGGWPQPQARDLKPIEVCAFSGHPVGPGCGATRMALARTQSVPTVACPYHVQVDVEVGTGLALTPQCRAGRAYVTRSFLQIPAEVRRYLTDQRGPLPGPPSLAEGCRATGIGRAPAIVSPPMGRTLVLLAGVDPEAQEVPLYAEAEPAGQELSWFVDGAFLGAAPSGERLWWVPSPGRHELVVVDREGREARQFLEVKGD